MTPAHERLLIMFLAVAVATVEGVIVSLLLSNSYDWKSYACSLADFLGRSFIIEVFLPFNIALPLLELAQQHSMHLSFGGPITAFLVLFFGEEFGYYWYHRCAHRVRWFWAGHMPHHSPDDINLGMAYRFGWTGVATGSRFFYLPLILLGMPISSVFGMLYLNLLYQFWVHCKWVPKLGWIEFVFNTPSLHRVHHASNPEYLDANFGGILIIFDWMFGTLVRERDDVPCIYGLVHPVKSYNPIRIMFHEWRNMAKDISTARNWRERWCYTFGPPGWHPAAIGVKTETEIGTNARAEADDASRGSQVASHGESYLR